MEIFLMVLSLSLVAVLVCGILFAAATREPRPAAAATIAAPEERFFVMRPPAAVRASRPVAADVLALQIAHHVRLEQAAAELFRQFPTQESLHTATLSPLAG